MAGLSTPRLQVIYGPTAVVLNILCPLPLRLAAFLPTLFGFLVQEYLSILLRLHTFILAESETLSFLFLQAQLPFVHSPRFTAAA